MEYTSIPVIIVICYIVGEIYKFIFKNKEELYKLIPLSLAIVGGLLGVLIYYTNSEVLLYADNVYTAIMIGIASGTSSTGANQIIKQLFSVEDTENDS